MAGAGLAGFFLVAGAAVGSIGRRPAAWVTAAAAGKLALFLGWAASHDEYDGVVVDTALAMAVILLLQIAAWVRRRAASAPGIVGGIVVSLGAAAVEALQISPGKPFSHDDLYHVIEIAAVFLLYRGGLRLEAANAP